MATKEAIDRFLENKALALIGASRTPTAFGNVVLRELHAKGFDVTIIHPEARQIASFETCPSINDLPDSVHAVVIGVQPDAAIPLVEEAIDKGIQHIWLLRGVSSEKARALAEQHQVSLIDEECILMYAEPVKWVHGMHRCYRKLTGTLPQ